MTRRVSFPKGRTAEETAKPSAFDVADGSPFPCCGPPGMAGRDWGGRRAFDALCARHAAGVAARRGAGDAAAESTPAAVRRDVCVIANVPRTAGLLRIRGDSLERDMTAAKAGMT